MKSLLNNKMMLAILSLMLLLAACEGPVGPAGPQGAEGPAGANGADGPAGPAGADGVGFDEAIAYGSITATFSGGLPVDSVPFEQTLEFPFTGSQDINSYTDIGEGYRSFGITRWYSLPSWENPQNNNIRFYLDMNESDDPATFGYMEFYVNTTIIQGVKFFQLNGYYETGSEDSPITEYSFNPETGELSFHFEFVIPGENNTSDFDITVSGDATVTVKEYVEGECIDC